MYLYAEVANACWIIADSLAGCDGLILNLWSHSILQKFEQKVFCDVARSIMVTILFLIIASSIYYVLDTFQKNMVFYHSPTEILSSQNIERKDIRLGGMVKENSIIRDQNSTEVRFFVTDYNKEILVKYNGILPDLFREKKGVVVEGYMEREIFLGKKVLAKHDENYMPPEVLEMIKSKEK